MVRHGVRRYSGGVSLPISSKYHSRPNDPVPESERQQLSEQLNAAFTRGDLSQEEFDGHLNTIFGAQRLGDLVPAVEALGKPQTYSEPSIVQQDGRLAPGEVSEIKSPSAGTQLAIVGGIIGVVAALIVVMMLLVFL
ncbi:uncharacterized protein DUF1707 [Propioniferax innocua]|uniref:Uncharacterized protein DUF1707 n=1 Tax=Propioniferax innocua TaxID=1753 RepID=A0A542ZSN0_9ACTN|nr:uncharacterized protein DUF1707 [Propioniferax innocua]